MKLNVFDWPGAMLSVEPSGIELEPHVELNAGF